MVSRWTVTRSHTTSHTHTHLWQVIAPGTLVVDIQGPVISLQRPCPLGEALVLPSLLAAKYVSAHVLGMVLLVILGWDTVEVYTCGALGTATSE